MEFGRSSSPFTMLSSTFLLLLLFTTFPSSIEALQCSAASACTPISKFNYQTFNVNNEDITKKSCDDACAMFWCLIDGKKAILGAGCYSDYAKICGSVSNNAVIDVKSNMFTIDDKEGDNALVVACKTMDDCATKWFFANKLSRGDFFEGRFRKGADEKYAEDCSNAPTSTTTIKSPDSAGFMNQMDGFKFFGMILSGLILAQFR